MFNNCKISSAVITKWLDMAHLSYYIMRVRHEGQREKRCDHPPQRLYAWNAYDGALCVACLDCHKILRGALDTEAAETSGASRRGK